MVNALPALVVEFGRAQPGYPPRGVIRVDVDDQGLVHGVHSVLAARKLTSVRFASMA